MKKNNLIILSLSFVNFATIFILTLLVIPEQIPYFVDINEKIILLGSKWILFASATAPIIIAFLSLIFSDNKTAVFCLNELFTLCLYENMLKMFYFCTEKSFALNSLSLIPIAVSVFMPISVLMLIAGQKMKYLKYKSVLGFRSKYSNKTEFLWKQTHIFASKVVSIFAILLFFVSIIFSFVRLLFVEIILFFVGIIICIIIVTLFSKSIYNKYMEMENRKNKLSKPESSENKENKKA